MLFLVFFSALGAATILPIASEITVVAAFHNGDEPALIWILASLGNTLGAVVNYVLGKYFIRFKGRSWFPFSQDNLSKGSIWFQRYGVWSLLLSWLPIVGDALTFVAGVTRVRFFLFLFLVFIGKSVRYAIIVMGLMQLF